MGKRERDRAHREHTMQYLATNRVTGYRETHIPRSYRGRRDGYGSRIPCRAWLELDSRRWYRLYAVCWGTGASLFINTANGPHYLQTGALEAIIGACGLTDVALPMSQPIPVRVGVARGVF